MAFSFPIEIQVDLWIGEDKWKKLHETKIKGTMVIWNGAMAKQYVCFKGVPLFFPVFFFFFCQKAYTHQYTATVEILVEGS